MAKEQKSLEAYRQPRFPLPCRGTASLTVRLSNHALSLLALFNL